jgi:hypothetical protein
MNNKPLSLKRTTGFILIVFLFSLHCAPAKQAQKVEAPGLYNMTGWNGAYIVYPNGVDYGTASGIDIECKKGYPVNVSAPSARAVGGSNKWNSTNNIVNNKLPPGLSFTATGGITGIPTERGHFIVTVEMTNIYVDGYPPGGTGKKYYKSFRQELRFHVSGSGNVNGE